MCDYVLAGPKLSLVSHEHSLPRLAARAGLGLALGDRDDRPLEFLALPVLLYLPPSPSGRFLLPLLLVAPPRPDHGRELLPNRPLAQRALRAPVLEPQIALAVVRVAALQPLAPRRKVVHPQRPPALVRSAAQVRKTPAPLRLEWKVELAQTHEFSLTPAPTGP